MAQATNTDAAWLEKKIEAAKIVNNVYIPEGPDQADEQEVDAEQAGRPAASVAPAAPAQPQASQPKQAEPHPPPPKQPPAQASPPAAGPGGNVAMRFLVPSQAKAPPKLPPS